MTTESTNHFKTPLERTLFALNFLTLFNSPFHPSTLKNKSMGLKIHDQILLGKGTRVDSEVGQPLNQYLYSEDK